MKRYFKFFVTLCLTICCISGLLQIKPFAEESPVLKEVPAYTAEFGDYGLTITSDDSDFLRAIEKIGMENYNYNVVDSLIEFDSSQWKVEGNQLLIPYSLYQNEDVEVNVFYEITVFAVGYADSKKTALLESYIVEVQFTMNQSGDIVIGSNDEKWIQSVYQSQNDSFLRVMSTPSLHLGNISVNDLIFEDGMILVSVAVQEKYKLYAGSTYLFSTSFAGKYGGIDLGELTITHGRSDAEYDSLVKAPDYTATFGDYGLSIVSENQDYLNEVDRILFSGDTNLSFTKSQWTVNGNELFISCSEYFEQGAKVNEYYRIIISAKGYFDSNRREHLGWSLAADVHLTVNEQGDIVITSSDEYWLKMLHESLNTTTLAIRESPSAHHAYIANTDLIYEDNQIKITPEVQMRYSMYTEDSYLISTSIIDHRYYYQDLGEVIITNGLMHIPSDIEIKLNDHQQLEISSSDENWLEGIIANKEKTGNCSMELFYADTEMHSYFFYNDENQTDFVWQNGSLVIELETLLERGITNRMYYCYLNSYPYAQLYDSIFIQDIDKEIAPSDVSIITDASGNIVITSADTAWLNGIVSYRSEGEAISIFDLNGNYYEGLVNNDIYTDLTLNGNSVVITPKAQKISNLIHGETYEFRIHVPGYHVSSGLNVTITKGVLRIPDDTKLTKDENGNLVVSSADQSFLECIDQSGAELYLVQENDLVDITNIALVVENGKVILPLSEIAEAGANDGVYTFYLRASGYEMVYWRYQVIDAYIWPSPNDISMTVDENTGDILITSSDMDWLKGLVSTRDEHAAIYVYDQSEEYVSWFWNTEEETDLVLSGDTVIISSDAQQRRNLYTRQTYLFNFYCDYYEVSDNFEVTILNGALNALPNDVTVVLDDSENLYISSQNTEWLDYLYHGTIEMYNEELNISWSFDKKDFKLSDQLVIPAYVYLDNDMSNGEYLIYLNADGYESGPFNVTLTKALPKAPDDIQIVFSESEGIVVTSEDEDYVLSITYLDLRKSENPSSVLYYYDDTQAIREQNRYVVPTETMKDEGVSSGDYDVFVYSSEYGAIVQTIHLPKEFFEIPDVLRIMGETRYETSFDIADALKRVLGVDKFDVVILATGEGFADALSGSYLAAKKGAPILMVNPAKNNISTIKEYLDKNMNPEGLVYILGGTSAVPSFVEEGLYEYTIKRLAGETRYDTNLLILEEAGVSDDPLLVCSGKGFADSLSASATGLPILLVDWTITDPQREFLQERGNHEIIVLGGNAAVSESVAFDVSFYGGTKRFAGETRYDTSAAVARYFFKDAEQVVLTYAHNYPDGICGGPLAYSLGAPMFLTSEANTSAANSYTTLKGITKGIVLGGPKLISDAAVEEILKSKPKMY